MQRSGLLVGRLRGAQDTACALIPLSGGPNGVAVSAKKHVSLILSDSPSARCLRGYLQNSKAFRLFHWYLTAEEALREIALYPPDMVLIDLLVPKVCGPECMHQLRKLLPKRPPLIALAYSPEPSVYLRLFQAGADGLFVLPGTPDSFEVMLMEAIAGGKPVSAEMHRVIVERLIRTSQFVGPRGTLSPAEQMVLTGFVLNLSDKEIAEAKGTSAGTIHSITNSIFKKLDKHNRTDAAKLFLASFQTGSEEGVAVLRSETVPRNKELQKDSPKNRKSPGIGGH